MKSLKNDSAQKKLKIFFKKNKIDLLLVIFLLLFSPLYFYNLNGYSLVDFDEAWYGVIAKNILTTHNPFLLYFNDQPYLDHPPFGFILIALSMLIFGINEFAVRLSSALLGFSSLIVLYFIGKNLFNRIVGLMAVLVLTSCVWFVFRSRTGNLDTPLVFFYLVTLYLTIKLKNSPKFIYLLSISSAALFLTKSFIGLTVIFPAVAYCIVNKIKISWTRLLTATFIFIILISPWLVQNYSHYGSAFIKNLYDVGARPTTRQNINFLEINKSQTFTYLHSGIGKWFYPALISSIFAIAFLFKNKNLVPICIWIIVLLYGFLTNSTTEIWHLLPVYPPIAILIGFCLFNMFSALAKIYSRSQIAIYLIAVVPVIAISLYQIYSFKNQIKLFDHETDGVAYTANAARIYPEKLYLDTDLFTPAVATFYSNKKVNIVKLENPPSNTLPGIFQFGQKPFLLLTQKWKLNLDGIDEKKYQILSQKDGYLLVKVI